ncbi:MAG: hypothetical protein EYC68_22210 [Chloroflexota bacterium]|nr:MAG: hypothetical protein EYC68_22210 [Chloroflexota bacterium]
MNDLSKLIPDIPSLLAALQKPIHEMLDIALYGDSTEVSELTYEMIIRWYLAQKKQRPDFEFGILYALEDRGRSIPRYYQGAFDKKFKCIAGRQLLPAKIEKNLSELFDNEPLLIFASHPKNFNERVQKHFRK